MVWNNDTKTTVLKVISVIFAFLVTALSYFGILVPASVQTAIVDLVNSVWSIAAAIIAIIGIYHSYITNKPDVPKTP